MPARKGLFKGIYTGIFKGLNDWGGAALPTNMPADGGELALAIKGGTWVWARDFQEGSGSSWVSGFGSGNLFGAATVYQVQGPLTSDFGAQWNTFGPNAQVDNPAGGAVAKAILSTFSCPVVLGAGNLFSVLDVNDIGGSALNILHAVIDSSDGGKLKVAFDSDWSGTPAVVVTINADFTGGAFHDMLITFDAGVATVYTDLGSGSVAVPRSPTATCRWKVGQGGGGPIIGWNVVQTFLAISTTLTGLGAGSIAAWRAWRGA